MRGGDAQAGALKTFYEGERPGSRENSAYFPMHKKGAIQMGNGGDNGNGSAGTFYEGVMTAGQPGTATTDAVQANIVAARYGLPLLTQSRLTSFRPAGTERPSPRPSPTARARRHLGVTLAATVPAGWTARATAPGQLRLRSLRARA